MLNAHISFRVSSTIPFAIGGFDTINSEFFLHTINLSYKFLLQVEFVGFERDIEMGSLGMLSRRTLATDMPVMTQVITSYFSISLDFIVLVFFFF